jgi:HK97 family phage portal protein
MELWMNLTLPAWFDSLRRQGRITNTADAYLVSPLLYRATNLRADAISTVPYRMYYKGEEQEWPFTQPLSHLIKEAERGLLITGGAYWYKIYKGRRLTGFVPLNPTTMNVNLLTDRATLEDPLRGAAFTQAINGKQYGPWSIDDVVYFREQSYVDDIGPGVGAAHVALSSAKLEHYLNRFAAAFFEGGAQPVTVMNLPESMDEAEFQRFRTDMKASVGGGVINAFRMIFMRSPDIKIEQLTPPLNSMEMPQLYERVVTSVGMAYGVPRTMLEASAANYATADSDRQSFWRETVIPRLSTYEYTLNTQVFAPLGWELRFEPESLDVMQNDEANRSSSLLQLVQAGVPLRSALTILGYDLVDDLVPPTIAPSSTAEIQPIADDTTAAMDIDGAPDDEAIATKRRTEFGLLAKKIERRIKAGKSIACTFESDVITADEVKSIMARLYDGMTVADVGEVVKAAAVEMTPDERRLYNRIVKEMEKRGATWARQIVQGKDVDPSLKDVIAPALQAELTRTAMQRFTELGEEFFAIDEAVASGRINDWLGDYVPKTTSQIDQTTADRIKQVIDTYRQTPGMTIQDIAEKLRPVADPYRASMIAITEMTRASTQAVDNYQAYLTENGITTTMYWMTQNDEKECDICGPLHNEPKDEWPADQIDGPPAHPNCRCSTYITTRRRD